MTNLKKKPRRFTKTHGETIRTAANVLTVVLQVVILIKLS